MGSICDSDELAIFNTDLVKDLIDYKWKNFAQLRHMIAALIHITYVICLIIYINKIFLESEADWEEIEGSDEMLRISPPPDEFWLCILGLCLLYPLYYDMR